MDSVQNVIIQLRLVVVAVVDNLKHKIIKDYLKVIKALQKGERINYEIILEEISLLDTRCDLDEHSYNNLYNLFLNEKFLKTL